MDYQRPWREINAAAIHRVEAGEIRIALRAFGFSQSRKEKQNHFSQ
jgi:hypothetical protein